MHAVLPQGFDKYGLYHMESIKTPRLRQALNLKDGLVSSGNSLDFCDEDMKLMDVRVWLCIDAR